LAGRHQVVEDAIDHRLEEHALVAVAEVVELERLQFNAKFGRYVFDLDGGEVGVAGLGAHAGELRAGVHDPIVAMRGWVGEGLDGRPHALRVPIGGGCAAGFQA